MSRRIVFALLLLGITLTGCKKTEATKSDLEIKTDGPGSQSVADGDNATKEIKLTIDNGDPKPIIVKVPFAEKMTVRDLLKAVEPQGITAEYKGEGEGAMLQALQGIRNEGGGEEAKNWIYYINGKPAWESSAVYSVQPGDVIIWRFEKYE